MSKSQPNYKKFLGEDSIELDFDQVQSELISFLNPFGFYQFGTLAKQGLVAEFSTPDSSIDSQHPVVNQDSFQYTTQSAQLVISAKQQAAALIQANLDVDASSSIEIAGCFDSIRCTDIFHSNSSFARSSGTSSGGSSGGKAGTLVSDYYSGSADGTAGYDIWVHFSGTGWTQTLQKAFINTANYLTSVVTVDIGGGGIINGNKVDDLYVSAELKAIDGVGGVLGQAGPTNAWTNNELTAAGQMQFDSADAGTYQNMGLWDDIVTHEFMHVMGFGSLWNYGLNPLAANSGQYTGTAGLTAYNQATGLSNTYIPVETSGGAGTANAHWSEAALGNELMTGYINNNNYMSKYSVMSLADLGYNIRYKDYQYDNVVIG